MTRTRNAHPLRVIALLFGVLTVLVLLGAWARMRGELLGMPSVASTKADANVLSPEMRHLPVVVAQSQALFLSAVVYGSGGYYAYSVAIADINGDGRADMLVADECVDLNDCNKTGGLVAVLLGNGDGTFQPAVPYRSGGEAPTGLAVADINGDGKQDVLVANEICFPRGPDCAAGEGSVGVLLGNGDGAFQSVVTYGSGGDEASSVAVADVNGDQKLDVVVANSCTSPGCSPDNHGLVGVLLGQGDGTFHPVVSYASGAEGASSIAITDVNEDGKLDLLVANACNPCQGDAIGAVGVLLGNGNGTFQQAVTYSSGGGSDLSLAVADVNGDGKPDLVVGNFYSDTVGVLLGNGDGTFQQVATYASGAPFPQAVVVADVNGDDKPDLLVANSCRTPDCGFRALVGVLLGNGDGTFQTAVIYRSAVHGSPHGFAVADVNGDHNPDVLVANGCVSNKDCATGAVSVLLHNPGPFTTKTAVTTSGSPSFVGQLVTFAATVTWTYGTVPDGELVTFYDGTTTLGSVVLAGGTAAFTTSALSARTHTIKATYTGDATFMPSTGTVTQVVNKYSTTTSLISNHNPSQFGQAVTFTAHVTGTGPSPTGKVKFLDGATTLGSATLSGGVAKLTKSTLAVGTHPITAQYMGDAFSAKSASPVVNQVVQ